MEFFFIDQSKFELTDYSYKDFDVIISIFGYEQLKGGFLRQYFDWAKQKHWRFKYEAYNELELTELFKRTSIVNDSIMFFVRLTHQNPIIKVNAIHLAEMLDDLCHETGMGWEAISVCGKYILEFTDSYEYLTLSNFEILPNSKVD